MDEIPGFWVGACLHGREYDLRVLAAEAGGYDVLQAGGEKALVAAGVDPVRARAWVSCRPQTSRGRVFTLADRRFPGCLRDLPEVPPFLCFEGDLACLEGTAVAVVGTRSCTGYGLGVARHLGGALAAAGCVVVSGLARGIDGSAHKAALRAGRTVAVLGHGLGHTAPSMHRRLREAIVDHGGLLVSEWPDEAPPRPWRFPRRNNWIAGLAQHTVVVEAPFGSGALITALAADAANRSVWVVPGQLGVPACRGGLELLHSKQVGVITDVNAFVAEVAEVGAAPQREDWLVHLFAGHPLEEVARTARRSTAELLRELATLELRGEVVRLPGQRYAPAGRPP